MSATVWPADAVSGAPSYTGRMLRQTSTAWAVNPSRPLCGLSGVAAGTPATIASATSSTYTVTPFKGVIDGEASALAGSYNFSFDSNQTGSVTAADATNPRIDLLSVRVSDPAEGDGTATPLIEVRYTAGTAAASPSPPATPARSMALANILVPHTGAGSPSTTLVAPFAVAAGGIQPTPSSASYPAAPYEGQVVDDAALDGLLRYSGARWDSLVRTRQEIKNTVTATANVPVNGSVVTASGTITPTGPCEIEIDACQGVLIGASASNYAGTILLKINGTTVRTLRFHNHGLNVPGDYGKAGNGKLYLPSSAGVAIAWSVTVTNDAASAGVFAYTDTSYVVREIR